MDIVESSAAGVDNPQERPKSTRLGKAGAAFNYHPPCWIYGWQQQLCLLLLLSSGTLFYGVHLCYLVDERGIHLDS
jgi:hypothetical protein